MKRIVFALSAAMLLVSVNSFSETLILQYFQIDHRYDYRIELLRLALEKTEQEYGHFSLEPTTEKMTQARGLKFMEEDKLVNIAFLPTSEEREQKFLPIRIPILKGILGYRVFLIHRDNLAAFSAIQSIDELKSKFTAGFDMHWADITILTANDIKVDKSTSYELLFKKLEAKRFDFFPRGINEAWDEIEQFGASCPNIVVDPHNAFYYPYPVYFFVNKTNVKTAERITKGLNIAQNDGSFKNLFLKYHDGILKKAELEKRKFFILENPTLPKGTIAPDTSWWLKKKLEN
ncbi:MAG: hypothetical protein HQK67_10505 [Desulfamplus sp.]|nr:hypothetical protein [Desulfamplus sp.]